MASQAEHDAADTEEGNESATPPITAHETTPDRLVFTEPGNTVGWIATDFTVDVTE